MTSQTITEFISRLNSLDIQLWIEGYETDIDKIRLRCNAPEGTLNAELRQELSARKAEIITYLQALQTSSTSAIQPTPGTRFPLSFAQQRLWFLDQLTPENPFYNVPTALRLTGHLNQAALEQSLNYIGRRHAALRTTFKTIDGQPIQVVGAEVKIKLSFVNLHSVSVEERDGFIQQLATAEAQCPFDLTTDALMRVTVLQFESDEAILLLTLHHIVADGWSLGVLIRELASCYTALLENQSPELPSLPIQYTDFACWQRHHLQGSLKQQLQYWQKQLQDLPVLQFPCDRPRPAVQTYRGAIYPIQFSLALSQSLATLAQQSGSSLFILLLAAFQTLLYRYTGQEDIVVGSPIANRHRSELEGLIGFFVNSLVMRADLSGNPTFREMLERTRSVALEAYEHQDLPFEKLVEALEPERDLSRNPLFQVAFALQNAPMQSLELPGLTLNPLPLESDSTRFDLEVHLWEPTHGLRSLWQSEIGLGGFISYSTDLFDRDRISRLAEHFQTVVTGIVANPDTRLLDLQLLTPAEQQQHAEWNQKGKGSPTERYFHQIFEAQVQQTPTAIAIVSSQGSLTYQDLNHKAEVVAQTLRDRGVQLESLVGLCVERSADLVIGILGIHKAGGAYVPIDPNYPRDRIQFILHDTQVAILLTQSWLADAIFSASVQVLCLDQPPEPWPLPSELQDTPAPTSDQLAYVIYTSGSTGTPKGVLLTHRGLCNVVEAQRQVFQASCTSRILQFSSLSFDASIFEIALAFGSGGTLYIPPVQLPDLVQYLKGNAITHALLTPAVLTVIPYAELPDLKVLITGGEACSSAVVDRWAANRRFFNAYGPTETTIWATVAELYPGDHSRIIGRPIPNIQVYVLDAGSNLVPVGIPGELYISGIGLARGYLNRPELTAERFISNPFQDREESPTTWLYQTGDRALYRPDGTIEFLGRVDTQIKLRGFRVELGEVETALRRHPAIQEAAVVPTEEPSHEMLLIAYFSITSFKRLCDHQVQQTVLESLQRQRLHHWQTLYNQTYQSSLPNPQFDITGWNSSYTGEPFSLEQMQEWMNDRVGRILALKPKRVLEIGCGTGLLLFQIAPHCEEYVGTDFSPVSLQAIQNQLEVLDLSQVRLLHRMATDWEGVEPAAFDVVILNSIVQYFPSQDYLMQVLESALQAVAAGGVLFVGDVRSLPLLTAFHTWVQFCQADEGLERLQLRRQVARSQFEDPELAIAPAFFYALRKHFSQIQRAQIHLSRGRSQTEMTQFRYNVLLHVRPTQLKRPSGSVHDYQMLHHDYHLYPVTVETIRKQLCEAEPEIFRITNVRNSRVNAAVKTADWLLHEASPKTVGRMREQLQDAVELSIDPQDWWDLEMELPYTVEIFWANSTQAGDYDVLFVRHGAAEIEMDIPWQDDLSGYSETNNPLQSQFAQQLVPELRHDLGQILPTYMVPSIFVPLETLPLTVNGKVDRRSLLSFYKDTRNFLPTPNAPKLENVLLTKTETTIKEIWQDLLRVKQVNIHDNFFELGGHSLLATQMISRVRDAFELELPLKSVFEAPTIAQLAPMIEALETIPAPKIPPIVRLDRSAYRRQHSALSENAQMNDSQRLCAQTLREQVHTTSSKETNDCPQPFLDARSPLVPLTLQGRKSPFFCVHPMFGVVLPYLELAHHLGDRSFYGLQPLGLDGHHPPLTHIETIAAYYNQAIQTLQPHGPYFLGGWSFGGLVAFEMAQQLTQAGHEVALLAMLDTVAPSTHQTSIYQSFKFLLGTALWSTLPFLLDYAAIAANRLRVWRPHLARWQWAKIISKLPEDSQLQILGESAIEPLLRIVFANSQAAYRYLPKPYAHPVTLFKAIDQSDADQDLALGWSSLANDIRVHPVPGNHLSFLKQPHVQVLAHQLRELLD